MTPEQRRTRFHELHRRDGVFVMPNAWDVGSAKLLAGVGFEAIATTSSGFAWTLGKHDQQVVLGELLEHVAALSAATPLPLSVDSERCYADGLDGVAKTVRLLHDAGAAGCSIEDYDPATNAIDPIGRATERVAAAAEAAHTTRDPMVLTARCENLLYGLGDLEDTITRLIAYRDAGADCLYAPGLATVAEIEVITSAVAAPVNVLAREHGPSVAEIGAAGGRRVSVGGALASTAYGAALIGARELLASGTSSYLATKFDPDDRRHLD